MVCVYCASPTKVTNSRPTSSVNGVWRRRRCKACGAIFTTEETVDISNAIRLRTKAGTLEPFLRDTLYLSIVKSLGHRPTASQDATALTRTVVSKVAQAQQGSSGVITRAELVAATHKTLQRFDKAAATQYAAYHPV